MVVELGARVNVGVLDGLEQQGRHSGRVDVDAARLEESLRRLEALRADLDHTAVGELLERAGENAERKQHERRSESTTTSARRSRAYRVGLDEHRGLGGEPALSLHVVRNVAELLLDLTHGLKVGRAVKVVAAELEELDEVLRHVATGDIETLGEMRQREALVHGHDVRHTITRVDDDARQETCIARVREGRLDEAHRGSERLEESHTGQAGTTYPERRAPRRPGWQCSTIGTCTCRRYSRPWSRGSSWGSSEAR